MRRRIKLVLSYDGTPFQGWQRQTRTEATIQGELERVLSRIYDCPITVIGSGRTDSGTHAVAQVAHFDAPKIIPTEPKLIRALNGLLPESVVVKSVSLAPPDFHAMFSVTRKTYIYRVWNHPVRSALWHLRAHWVQKPLNLELLNDFSSLLVGEHDFKSFQTTGTPVPSTVRTIEHARWQAKHKYLLEFSICGDGFLKQMVRNIVGAQLYLERNGGTPADFQSIVEAKDRRKAKDTAPAHGLYLYRVEYPRELDNKCLKL